MKGAYCSPPHSCRFAEEFQCLGPGDSQGVFEGMTSGEESLVQMARDWYSFPTRIRAESTMHHELSPREDHRATILTKS